MTERKWKRTSDSHFRRIFWTFGGGWRTVSRGILHHRHRQKLWNGLLLDYFLVCLLKKSYLYIYCLPQAIVASILTPHLLFPTCKQASYINPLMFSCNLLFCEILQTLLLNYGDFIYPIYLFFLLLLFILICFLLFLFTLFKEHLTVVSLKVFPVYGILAIIIMAADDS